MANAYLLTGSNLNDRYANLEIAREKISKYAGTLLATSSVYETEPWGLADQPEFLNQALYIETALNPLKLLEILLDIEISAGRKRLLKNGPRMLDIDILLYDDLVINTPQLKVPHPEMQNRRFVLMPLCEIAADVVHPLLNKPIIHLLAVCPDPLAVKAVDR